MYHAYTIGIAAYHTDLINQCKGNNKWQNADMRT